MTNLNSTMLTKGRQARLGLTNQTPSFQSSCSREKSEKTTSSSIFVAKGMDSMNKLKLLYARTLKVRKKISYRTFQLPQLNCFRNLNEKHSVRCRISTCTRISKCNGLELSQISDIKLTPFVESIIQQQKGIIYLLQQCIQNKIGFPSKSRETVYFRC